MLAASNNTKHSKQLLLLSPSLWFLAIHNLDRDTVKENVNRFARFRRFFAGGDGETGLIEASRLNDTLLVSILLPYEMTLQTISGETALMVAAKLNHVPVVKLLAKYEAGIQDNIGRTALMYALIHHNFNIASILFQRELGYVDSQGNTELYYAATSGNTDVFALLLSETLKKPKGVETLRALQHQLSEKPDGILPTIYSLIQEHLDSVSKQVQNNSKLIDLLYSGHTAFSRNLLRMYTKQTNSKGQTALMIAISLHLPNVVEILLEYELFTQDNEGHTALMYAAKLGLVKCATLLLEEAGQQDSQGNTALMLALKSHHWDVARLLAKCPLEHRHQNNGGWTSLMLSAKLGRTDIAEHLISETRMRSYDQQTAFNLAIAFKNEPVAILLAKYEYDIPCFTGEPPYVACLKAGFLLAAEKIKEALSSAGIPVHATSLIEAADTNDTTLLNANIDKVRIQDSFGMTATMYAALRKHNECLSLLVAHEREMVDNNSWTALMHAARVDNIEGVRVLSKYEAGRRNNQGWTALMNAAKFGHIEIARLLKDAEACLQSEKGATALHIAAQHGFNNIVDLLLDKEQKIQDFQGWTALMNATHKSHADCISLLAPYEAKLRTIHGKTAMMIGANQIKANVIKILLPYEGRCQDVLGMTAMMYAAQSGYLDNVKALAEVETDIVNNKGERAIDLARKGNYKKIALFLSNFEI